jgi:thymidylate synthase (FAD)
MIGQIDVGDGWVRLHDYMPRAPEAGRSADETVASVARTSYGHGGEEFSTARNRRLLDYLMRHRHTGPFEFVVFILEFRVPFFLARQLQRHRTGSYNEESARYTEVKRAYWLPTQVRVHDKNDTNPQNSVVAEAESGLREEVCDVMNDIMESSFDTYDYLIDMGVAREQARAVLPLGTYTTFFMAMDLHNLLHLLKLRLAPDAQAEMREVADAVLRLIEPIVPHAVASWRNHVRDAVTLSADEVECIRQRSVSGDGILPSETRRKEYQAKVSRFANK